MQEHAKAKGANLIMIMRIIWFALIMGHFAFALVLFARISRKQNLIAQVENLEVSSSYRMPLILSAFVLLLASVLLPKLLFKTQLKKIASLDRDKVIQAYYVPFVILLVLSEGISILGLIQGLSALDFKPYIAFAVIGLGNILINFPTEKKIFDLADFRA